MVDDESEMTDDLFEEYDEDEDFEHDPEQIAKFLIFGTALHRKIHNAANNHDISYLL